MRRRSRSFATLVRLHLAGWQRPADDWTGHLSAAIFGGPTWLPQKQRLCFAVEGSNLDSVIKDGTNVICGGTNAAGIGFAGGPFILGKDGEIVDIRSGVPVPEKTLGELRARVDQAHAKGAKVLGEVIRFYMTPWIQAEHPEWQEMNSPGAKPITGRAAQGHARAGLLEFALRRLVHQVASRAGEAAGLGRLQHGRIRVLGPVLLPGLRRRHTSATRARRFPRPAT